MKKAFFAYDVKEENYKKLENLYSNIKEETIKICLVDTHRPRPREIFDDKEELKRCYEELKDGMDVLIVAVDTENNGVININHMLEKLIKKARELKMEIRYYSLLSNSITIERENKVNFKPDGYGGVIMADKQDNIISVDTTEGRLEFDMNKESKMITICGSTKQKDQILELKAMLEAKGHGVLTPEFNVKTMSESIAFAIHKAKMDVSDVVYFLLKPKDGLGHSAGIGMQREIRYCIQQEKEIVFVSPDEIRI